MTGRKTAAAGGPENGPALGAKNSDQKRSSFAVADQLGERNDLDLPILLLTIGCFED
jgi:hypothetical protein